MPAFSPSLRAGLTAAAFAVAGMGAGAVFRALSAPPGKRAAALPGLPPTGRPPGKTGEADAGTASVIDAFARAGTPGQQLAAALHLGEHGTAEEIRALLDQAFRFPAHSADSVARITLLKRWLALEPEAAVEYCREHMEEHLPKMIASWSATDQDAAERFVRSLPPDGLRTAAWTEMCQAAADRDPKAAWALLRRMPGNQDGYSNEALRGVLAKLVAADPEKALREMADLPASALKAARQAISQEWMGRDPAGAWEWISRQPNPAELMRRAFYTGMSSDPARTLDLLAGATPAQREKVVSELGYNTGDRLKNLPALAAALSQNQSLPPAERAGLVERILGTHGWQAPAEMTALLPLLSPEQLADGTAQLLSHWAARDKTAAHAWVDGLPDGPIRQAALEANAAREMREAATPQPDPGTPEGFVAAFKAGRSFGDDAERLGRLNQTQLDEILSDTEGPNHYRTTRIWDMLAEQNPAAAAAWLQTQIIDKETGRKAARFAAQWANEDPAAAAAWVGSLSDGALARTAAENVARQYQRYAPAQAAAWIQSLPAGPVRDAALAGAP